MYGMTQVHPVSCPGKAPACTMPGWDVAVTAQALGSGLTSSGRLAEALQASDAGKHKATRMRTELFRKEKKAKM